MRSLAAQVCAYHDTTILFSWGCHLLSARNDHYLVVESKTIEVKTSYAYHTW